MNNRCCFTCKWCHKNKIGDTLCVKDKSEMCCEYVDKNNICEYWEDDEE